MAARKTVRESRTKKPVEAAGVDAPKKKAEPLVDQLRAVLRGGGDPGVKLERIARLVDQAR